MFFVVSYLRKTGTGTTYKSDLFLVPKVFSVVSLVVRLDCLLIILLNTQYLFIAKQKLFLTLVTWTGLAIILTHSEPGNSNLFNYIITMSITHHVFPGTLQLFTQF